MTVESVSVAIQGQDGSYHDQAARHYFGEAYDPRYEQTFADVFNSVEAVHSDYGLTAVENSLVGSIVPVYDLLHKMPDVSIMGEVYLSIHHSLIGVPGTRLDDIREVYSHPVALAQCTDFLGRELPDAVTHTAADTVASVRLVRERGEPSTAAIAGANNAEPNGLAVLQEAIENNSENYTRFLALGRRAEDDPGRRAAANKTSLFVERLTGDTNELAPGTLHRALGCFAAADVGLTKVESRPIAGRPWRYNFYFDCAAGAEEPRMQAALEEFAAIGGMWRELGTYRHGDTV